MMKREPIEQEVKEFSKVRKWTGSKGGRDEKFTEYGSFAEIEYKYFEGYNLLYRINILGEVDNFEKAHERMTRYQQLSFEAREKLRTS